MSQTEGSTFLATEKAPSAEDQQAQQEADIVKPEVKEKSAHINIIEAFTALPINERVRLYDDLSKCIHKDADALSTGQDKGIAHYEDVKKLYS